MADAPNPDPSKSPDPNADPSAGADPNKGKEGEGGDDDKPTIPRARLNSEIEKRRTAETELERYRKEEQARKEKEAIDKGEHEKVIADLRPKAERAAELESALIAVIDAEIAAIPKERQSLVPDLPPEKKLKWITDNRAILTGEPKKKDVNNPLNPADGDKSGGDNQTFTKAQIADPAFYEKNRDAIMKAMREGRIRD